MGPADPARDAEIGAPRRTAHELIATADAARARHRAPTRRLVLVGGAAAVAAAGVAVATRWRAGEPEPAAGPAIGTVLVPIGYQYDTGAPPAGTNLRDLADRIGPAPYDGHTGRYAYHDVRIWGDPIEGSGPYLMGLAYEQKAWQAADGTGRQTVVPLEPEFPDAASRAFWQKALRGRSPEPPHTYPLPPNTIAPLPTDRAGVARLLDVAYGVGAVAKALATVYAGYAVPLPVRVQILRVLADVPGLVWRGTVTDRGGRTGVAVTYDDRPHGEQHLIVVDPGTGVLLATELLLQSPKRIATYQLILATDRTDTLG